MKKLCAFIVSLVITASALAQTYSGEVLVDELASYRTGKFSKAPRKVYIQSFRVLFQVMASATAKSSEGVRKGATKTSMAVAITGVDLPDFQQVTDNLYNDLIASLTRKGFELVHAEEAAKTEHYKDWVLKTGGKASFSQMAGHVMITPTGYSYFVKDESKGGKEKGTFTDKSSILSKQLNDAIVLDVSMVFPFVEMDAASSGMLGFSAVKATVDFGLEPGVAGTAGALRQNMVKFVYGNAGMGQAESYLPIVLKKKVTAEGVFFDKKFKEFNSAALNKVYDAGYYSVVTTENKNETVSHEAACDPEKYKAASLKLGGDLINKSLEIFYKNAEK
ncbi:MAG: hypothetical protein BroJett042_05570 [Bacteroidota bacterium]|nr:MAG: hypothetical protein UZ12_BCD005000979 [Bacteroidetes bacterium OLB12]GIL22044.1 MAG: hypothetical protein BroJett042_05570 [Bacteroidota bacterium]HNR74782.1 hypothetical protein [Cyclobacteriaceae bacterium]HNU41204.1 hypothetical protein [Cyclobacteriaceae bacterium]